MVYTTYKNGDLGNGLLLLYPHYLKWQFHRHGKWPWQLCGNAVNMASFHPFPRCETGPVPTDTGMIHHIPLFWLSSNGGAMESPKI
jgi:hypothetical protein